MNAQTYLETHWIKKQIWTHLLNPKHQDRLRRCAAYLEGSGERFIDVGCGLGHSTDIMRGFLPGQWSGLEFFAGAKPLAEKTFPDLEFYVAPDFNLLPVCGQFDGVVCSEVIEHVEDDRGLIRGLLEITRGRLVLTTPNRKVNDPGHLRVYTKEMLVDLFLGDNADMGASGNIESIGRFFYIVVRR